MVFTPLSPPWQPPTANNPNNNSLVPVRGITRWVPRMKVVQDPLQLRVIVRPSWRWWLMNASHTVTPLNQLRYLHQSMLPKLSADKVCAFDDFFMLICNVFSPYSSKITQWTPAFEVKQTRKMGGGWTAAWKLHWNKRGLFPRIEKRKKVGSKVLHLKICVSFWCASADDDDEKPMVIFACIFCAAQPVNSLPPPFREKSSCYDHRIFDDQKSTFN